ncbi:MAG TPA: MFS transporter [Egibacteraceae bacterium]|nr:MFS transporter [Egibacteraceae bacterium]
MSRAPRHLSAPSLRILAPLRHRDYRLVVAASLVSLFGDGFFLVAIALQVYAVSNVPTAMSVVGAVWSGSALLFLLVGGWASDHLQRRRIMIAADVVRGLAIGSAGVLSLTGRLQLWHLVALGGVFGAGNAFFNPAATSIVPDLLPSAELPRANALLGVARPAMVRLAGPALGGVLVAAAGPGSAFLVDATTFLLSAALLTFVSSRPVEASPGAGLRTWVADVSEGFGFVRARPWCWAWLAGAALSMLAYYGPLEVLVPFVLKNELALGEREAARWLGFIFAAGGLGAVGVSVVVGQTDLPRRFVTAMYAGEAVAVLAIATYGFMTSPWQGMLAALVVHGGFAFSEITWTTMLQRLVPRRLLGRVSSVDWLTSVALIPVSFALAAPLAQQLSPRGALVAAALLGGAVLTALPFSSRVREPERPGLVLPPGGTAGADPVPREEAAGHERHGTADVRPMA